MPEENPLKDLLGTFNQQSPMNVLSMIAQAGIQNPEILAKILASRGKAPPDIETLKPTPARLPVAPGTAAARPMARPPPTTSAAPIVSRPPVQTVGAAQGQLANPRTSSLGDLIAGGGGARNIRR